MTRHVTTLCVTHASALSSSNFQDILHVSSLDIYTIYTPLVTSSTLDLLWYIHTHLERVAVSVIAPAPVTESSAINTYSLRQETHGVRCLYVLLTVQGSLMYCYLSRICSLEAPASRDRCIRFTKARHWEGTCSRLRISAYVPPCLFLREQFYKVSLFLEIILQCRRSIKALQGYRWEIDL